MGEQLDPNLTQPDEQMTATVADVVPVADESVSDQPIIGGFRLANDTEAAWAAARKARAHAHEQASLAKTYTPQWFAIEPAGDTFRVTTPGLRLESGHYMGTSTTEHPDWPSARDHYLGVHEAEAVLAHEPILEVQAGPDTAIVFSRFDRYNPRVAPTTETFPIPDSIQQHLLRSEQTSRQDTAGTYYETTKQPGWDKELFGFVKSYYEHHAPDVIDKLNIKHFDALTPKQAAELATGIVIDLTKYRWADSMAGKGDSFQPGALTTADKSSTRQLLSAGLMNHERPEWQGNGVCRNFADMTKAVFEALKANQTDYSRLRNTYCLADGGNDSFAPAREEFGRTTVKPVASHAWNTFVTISREGDAHASVVDVTWADRDPDTKQPVDLDHTLTRMEPVIHDVGQQLDPTDPASKAEAGKLMTYYGVKLQDTEERAAAPTPALETLDEDAKTHYRDTVQRYFDNADVSHLSDDALVILGQRLEAEESLYYGRQRERRFFADRAVELAGHAGGDIAIPDNVLETVAAAYQELGDKTDPKELSAIYDIAANHDGLDFAPILDSYLAGQPINGSTYQKLLFADSALQFAVYDAIKDRADFVACLGDCTELRVRIREIAPQDFAAFSPLNTPADAQEIRYLADRSAGLHGLAAGLSRHSLDPLRVSQLILSARGRLRDANQATYDASIADTDDYTVIKHYDAIRNELAAKAAST